MNLSVETLLYISLGLQVLVIVFAIFISFKYIGLKKVRESEYWTDYEHNEIVFRIYKWEFESQAFNGLKRGQVLDRGDLNQFYRWLLFTKKRNNEKH